MKSLSLKLFAFFVALGVSQLLAGPISFDFEGSAQGFTAATGTQSGSGAPWALTGSGCAGGSTGCFTVNDPPTINDHYLLSPLITTGVNGPTLSFDHSRSLESTFDGGVVEIAVNGGSFFDVFVSITNPWITNGYNATISSSFSSPIGGRQAFSGNSLGYVNSSILLNTVSPGDTFQLRWRRASDDSVAGTGWTVDNILLSDGALAGAVPEPGFAIPIVLVLSGMVLARRRRVKP
jgi:hypothetical protein